MISSSFRKSRDFVPNIQEVDTEQLDDETLQITVTLKGDSKDNKEENICDNTKKHVAEPAVSESELGDFDANRRQERSLRKQQKKKIKDKKSAKPINKEKGKKISN